MAELDSDRNARHGWLGWARTYVDSIDPLKNVARIAKVLTPKLSISNSLGSSRIDEIVRERLFASATR
jgi:hypothetical protein